MNLPPLFPFSPPLMLETARIALERRADLWFDWLIAATVCLFVGVIFDDKIEWILPARYRIGDAGSVFATPTRETWQHGLKEFGFWLAIFSIIGEGLFEVLGARAEGRVRQFNNDVLVFTQGQAANANERAGDALLEQEKLRTSNLVLQRELSATANPEATLRSAKTQFALLGREFPAQQFDLVNCRRDFSNPKLGGVMIAFETLLIGWKKTERKGIGLCSSGITVVIDPTAPASTKRAANALQSLLISIGLALPGTKPTAFPKSANSGLLKPPSPEVISIALGFP